MRTESAAQPTTYDEVSRALDTLSANKARWARLLLTRWIELIEQCIAGVAEVADDWIATACHAKGIDPRAPIAAEEIAAGPLATVRFLRLMAHTLSDIERSGVPRLPGRVTQGHHGCLQVPVMPSGALYDRLLFGDYSARVWMQPEITRKNLAEHMGVDLRESRRTPAVALVLGAGNVSAIPATDALGRLFQQGHVVLLKMNPVNEYLGAIFERAFSSLIGEGVLRIVYGGAEIGGIAANDPRVDEIHITGSVSSHEAIVWGPPGANRENRKSAGEPLLKKPITSELGNVTPWIVVPGEYSERELDFQAENVAAMVLNNASFNCIAAKLIITHRAWSQRERFLDKISNILAGAPPRQAYYPGAAERFRRFAAREPSTSGGTLPWILLRDVRPDVQPHLFNEESFVCVFAETAIDADGPAEFLDQACDFANERVAGTLGAGIAVPKAFRREPRNESRLQHALGRLRYGTVAINHWPGLGYAMMSTPWGGYPGATLARPESGIGWVHNTFLLDGIEKTVIEGPLVVRPKPLWFPTHRQAHVLAQRVLDLYCRPSWWKLPGVFWPALRA